MASSLVQDERIQTLNDVEQWDGEYVLEYAVQRANDLGQRLPASSAPPT